MICIQHIYVSEALNLKAKYDMKEFGVSIEILIQ